MMKISHNSAKTITCLVSLFSLAILVACAAAPTPPAANPTLETVPSSIPTTAATATELPTDTPAPAGIAAGLRASSYGIQPFPAPDWWLASSQSMAGRFPDAQPTVIWIVGVVGEAGEVWLNFPADTPTDDPYLRFEDSDFNEEYLQAFDQAGVRVWLQVEPGQADVASLIDLVLGRYGGHPSVAGFGIDVEWYQQDKYTEGRPVGDAEAQRWRSRVDTHNPDYVLFLKHWLPEKMPPGYRQGLVFVDDSQEFSSMQMMVDEFEIWGETFGPAPVAFQYGYQSDQPWWGALDDPPREIGETLIERLPNLAGLFWVDFTAEQLWPLSPAQ